MPMPSVCWPMGTRLYKGNVHAHSRRSDGRLTPAEVARAYREAGYHFLALSDHERYADTTEFDTEEFLLIPAVEYAVNAPGAGFRGHHFQGLLGTEEALAAAGPCRLQHDQVLQRLPWRGPQTVQRAVDFLRASGQFVIYNHPVWSRLEVDDLLAVQGLLGIEVYNHGCAVEDATGRADLLWDQMLRRGRRVFGIASDDNHNHWPFGSPACDSFGGWIAVAADRLTRAALATALGAGRFYASTGPEVLAYEVSGLEVHVASSPVARIQFITYERRGAVRWADPHGQITAASHRLHGDEVFVRVECVDHFGRTAWTNPIFLEDLT
jgi:hypothetical protein